jgi:hypothetical protein
MEKQEIYVALGSGRLDGYEREWNNVNMNEWMNEVREKLTGAENLVDGGHSVA